MNDCSRDNEAIERAPKLTEDVGIAELCRCPQYCTAAIVREETFRHQPEGAIVTNVTLSSDHD
jgi:hypothetical protein